MDRFISLRDFLEDSKSRLERNPNLLLTDITDNETLALQQSVFRELFLTPSDELTVDKDSILDLAEQIKLFSSECHQPVNNQSNTSASTKPKRNRTSSPDRQSSPPVKRNKPCSGDITNLPSPSLSYLDHPSTIIERLPDNIFDPLVLSLESNQEDNLLCCGEVFLSPNSRPDLTAAETITAPKTSSHTSLSLSSSSIIPLIPGQSTKTDECVETETLINKKPKTYRQTTITCSEGNRITLNRLMNKPTTNMLTDKLKLQKTTHDTKSTTSDKRISSLTTSITSTNDLSNDMGTAISNYRDIFNIDNAKNIRKFRIKWKSNHIFEWSDVKPTGYGIHISGQKYEKGMVKDIIIQSKLDFSPIRSILEYDDSSLVILGQEDRCTLLINEMKLKGLDASIAGYRLPIIKFWMKSTLAKMKNWRTIVEEIKMFNLKSLSPAPFTYWREYSPMGSYYTLLYVQVDQAIRSYIETRLNGFFWYDNKQIEISDHFSFRRCYTCGSVKHKKCTGNQLTCMLCSGPHHKRDCTSKTLKCPTCGQNHKAFSIECPSVQQEIASEMDRIDFAYKNILAGKSF